MLPLLVTLSTWSGAAETERMVWNQTQTVDVTPDGRVKDVVATAVFGNPGDRWSRPKCNGNWARIQILRVADRPGVMVTAKPGASAPATLTCMSDSLSLTWTLLPKDG